MSTIIEQSHLGHRAAGFLGYRSIADLDFPKVEEPIIEVDNPTSEKGLLDMIFSVNPITLLPDGDIAMLFHKDTPPDVRRFIEANLHQPVDVSADASGQFVGLDDDVIAELTRGVSESLNSYRRRVVEYVKDNYSPEQKEG